MGKVFNKLKALLNEEPAGEPKGEPKKATFNRKRGELEYWDSRNTTTRVQANFRKAAALITQSGVEQTMETI